MVVGSCPERDMFPPCHDDGATADDLVGPHRNPIAEKNGRCGQTGGGMVVGSRPEKK